MSSRSLLPGILGAVFVLAVGGWTVPVRAGEKPVIFWASDPIGPGQTLMIQGHAFTEDAVVEASPSAGGPVQKLQILGRSEQCLKALIPADWKANVYEFHVRTGSDKATALLNRPAAVWWVGDLGDRQSPGGRFRICGRNMLGDAKALRVRVKGEKNVDVTVEKAEPYSLTALLPADTPVGQYQLQVHNGWGQEAGWSDPIPFVVARPPAWPQTVFNVTDFGAKGRGDADDTHAVQAALAKAQANGGGIVFFPRGRYQIRATLAIPRFTVLRGEKREWAELLWPDQPKPCVLVKGTNSFGLEDLTLAALNYTDGIVSDGGWEPDSGDVFLRRLRVRAMRYTHVPFAEVQKRFAEAHANCGGATVSVGGRNIEVTDCDLYGSGCGLTLTGVRGGRVSGNIISNGPYGWYSLTGIGGLIFENNEVIGASEVATGGSLNTFFKATTGCENLYFAHNRIHTVYGDNREATTSDGGGGCHSGRIVSADGVKLVLSDEPRRISDIWNKEATPGMGVYILSGRGAGQWRRAIKQVGRTVEIDRPWDVAPDATSMVSISMFQGNYFLIGNEYADATCAIQMYSVAIGHVIAGNTSARAGGFQLSGLIQGSAQPVWYCQVIDNQILEGNGVLGPFNETQPLDSHVAVTASVIPALESPLARCVVIRGNRLHNNARIDLTGSVTDAVVEHNTVENADVGVHVEPTVSGAVVRENKFVNVRQP
ncbi:MAG: glycosyl hydrolase family 28-related protein [Planctomycetota bacterium]|nr:glycosyl hydrolase family 28-related protein [Planctomycetota bacterium]